MGPRELTDTALISSRPPQVAVRKATASVVPRSSRLRLLDTEQPDLARTRATLTGDKTRINRVYPVLRTRYPLNRARVCAAAITLVYPTHATRP